MNISVTAGPYNMKIEPSTTEKRMTLDNSTINDDMGSVVGGRKYEDTGDKIMNRDDSDVRGSRVLN